MTFSRTVAIVFIVGLAGFTACSKSSTPSPSSDAKPASAANVDDSAAAKDSGAEKNTEAKPKPKPSPARPTDTVSGSAIAENEASPPAAKPATEPQDVTPPSREPTTDDTPAEPAAAATNHDANASTAIADAIDVVVDETLTLRRMVLARDVIDREPVGLIGDDERFAVGDRANVFVEFANAGSEGRELTVKWSGLDGRFSPEPTTVSIPVGKRYRSRAYTRPLRREGSYQVSILGPDGGVVHSLAFDVITAANASE